MLSRHLTREKYAQVCPAHVSPRQMYPSQICLVQVSPWTGVPCIGEPQVGMPCTGESQAGDPWTGAPHTGEPQKGKLPDRCALHK